MSGLPRLLLSERSRVILWPCERLGAFMQVLYKLALKLQGGIQHSIGFDCK